MPTKSWIQVPIDQEIADVCEGAPVPYFFPPEGGTALFSFTDAEFTQVLSALINGAALTFPDEWIQVVWYFLRNMECPVSLCDAIADCIANNPGTRQAIIDLVTSDQTIHDYIYDTAVQAGLTEGERNTNILKPGECDPAYVFNQASELVSLIHELVGDIFDAIETATNPVERAQLLVQGAPGIGILPFDELIGFGNMLIENVQEEYDGAWDAALYDEIRCALFCKAKDSCVLTIDDAVAFYEQQLPASFANDPLQLLLGIIAFISNGDFPTDTAVYGMHLLVIALIRHASAVGIGSTTDVLGIDFTRLGLRVIAAGDEPNNDWETICEECVDEPFVRMIPAPGWNDDYFEFIDNPDANTSRYLITFHSFGGYAGGGGVTVGGEEVYVRDVDILSGSWPDGSLQMGGGAYNPTSVPCDVPTTYVGVYITSAGGAQPVNGDQIRITVSRDPCPAPGWLINEGNALENSATTLVIEAVLSGGAYRARADPIDGKTFTVSNTSLTGTPDFKQYVDVVLGTVTAPIPDGATITRFYYGHFASAAPFTLTINGVLND